MTIDKIKSILPEQIYNHWMECHDVERMEKALKELRWMLDNQKELLLTGDLVNRYYAEIELLTLRTSKL